MKSALENIMRRIQAAANACGRDASEIRLVAVSKTVSAERIAEAVASGVQILGENYIQESREKYNRLGHLDVSWHFIGHLQSNKAKYAVRMFDLIHTVDSLKLAQMLDREAQKHNKVQAVLIQVNLAGEASKSGAASQDVLPLLKEISHLENIAVQGLMTIPPFFDDPEKARPYFKELRQLRDDLSQARIPNISLHELSMGMSGDFEAAIAEGATLVRIGTAIFGART